MKRAMKEFYRDAFSKDVLFMSFVIFVGMVIGTWLGR